MTEQLTHEEKHTMRDDLRSSLSSSGSHSDAEDKFTDVEFTDSQADDTLELQTDESAKESLCIEGNKRSLPHADAMLTKEKSTIAVQTDVGGIDAFYREKSVRPFMILEEGVKIDETAYPQSHNAGGLILMANNGSQTSSAGTSCYHKATQLPEMNYNPYTNKNVIKPELLQPVVKAEKAAKEELSSSNESTASALMVPCSTQTDMAGYAMLHKATQYPDKDYPDPGHPPPPAPSTLLWQDQQLLAAQLAAAAQQQQQQQLLLQQQLQYQYIDPTTGLPLLPAVSQATTSYYQQPTWPYFNYQQYP